jgi:hypothetical protein
MYTLLLLLVFCYIIIAPVDPHEEGNHANHSFLPRHII